MAWWQEKPEGALSGVVARWCYSTAEGLELPWKVSVDPDGCADLVVAVDAAGGGEGRCEVLGVKTRAIEVTNDRAVETIAVQFRPGGLRRVFGISADALTDGCCDGDALSGAFGHEFRDRLTGADGFSERKHLVASAISASMDRVAGDRWFADRESDRVMIEAATRWIRRASGVRPVRELAAWMDVNPRRLERLFLRHVGVGPKRYSRVIRLKRAKEMIAAGRPTAWVAATLGFTDQAHLCREFRAMTGRSPTGRCG